MSMLLFVSCVAVFDEWHVAENLAVLSFCDALPYAYTEVVPDCAEWLDPPTCYVDLQSVSSDYYGDLGSSVCLRTCDEGV